MLEEDIIILQDDQIITDWQTVDYNRSLNEDEQDFSNLDTITSEYNYLIGQNENSQSVINNFKTNFNIIETYLNENFLKQNVYDMRNFVNGNFNSDDGTSDLTLIGKEKIRNGQIFFLYDNEV